MVFGILRAAHNDDLETPGRQMMLDGGLMGIRSLVKGMGPPMDGKVYKFKPQDDEMQNDTYMHCQGYC
eukprot:CAMPEP_0169451694 /NCGR_PEP_ID=MMETSP1042-20121227/13835_1 /TAXON_ID=464988 /ORGANISM="Hemiselmis andersenii, Strain CCMP1180" /LENGTH=67 /DNA_ID=CAMNT_0009563625 /DNA_START=1 /DNA_END=204 /DNA_ORIENTATION=+